MNFLEQYLARANEIIGDRTPQEQKYDNEVIRWIRKCKSIKKAIAKANEKYPSEALLVNQDNLADVQAHYEDVANYHEIMEKIKAIGLWDDLRHEP